MTEIFDTSTGDLKTRAQVIEQQARELLPQHLHFRRRVGRFECEYREDKLIVRGCVPSFYLKQILQTYRGGQLAFHSGIVAFEGNVIIGSGYSQITNLALFGPNPEITWSKGLAISGRAILVTPLSLDGGTLSVGSLINASYLFFGSGTVFVGEGSELSIGHTLTLWQDGTLNLVGRTVRFHGRIFWRARWR